ncbi:MAG TPA: hypothetical protein VF688_13300 [Allosphingosinicella sp.]|jgi:hypothetical protein
MAQPSTPDPNAGLKAETERLKAETELEKAKAERVKALGLPSFEGKTVLNQGAGAIEALLLSSDAMEDAADRVAAGVFGLGHPGDFIVLAGDETIDMGLPQSLRIQMNLIQALFARATGGAPADRAFAAGLGGVGALTAGIGLVAGMLRSDKEITAVDLPGLTHRLFAAAVAARLRGRAILPGAAIGPLPEVEEEPDARTEKPLLQVFGELAQTREEARELAAAMADVDPGKPALVAAIARYDAFFASATSAGDKGVVPIALAARLDPMMSRRPLVLRVYVEKAGGSLITIKNIKTYFGKDPLTVSAGLVASYMVTDPRTGRLLTSEILTCRTAVATLEEVQKGTRPGRRRARLPAMKPLEERAGGQETRAMGFRSAHTAALGVTYKITVKPKDGTGAGWIMHSFESHPAPVGDVNYQPIHFSDQGDGTFTANLDFGRGEYGLACDLALAGREVEIDVEPRPKIFQPFGKQWPFTARVPSGQTMELVKIFFNTGEQQ